MKKLSIIVSALLILAAHDSFAKRPTAEKEYRIVPGEIVVKVKAIHGGGSRVTPTDAVSMLQSAFRLESPRKIFTAANRRSTIESDELDRIFLYTVPSSTDIEALARQISGHPDVEYAEPHYYFRIHSIPNDPLYPQQFPLDIVNADSAWHYQKGDSTVVIGIIDSGVDWDHPDLAAMIWNNTDEIPNNGIDDDGNGFIDDVRGWDFVAGVLDAAVGEDGSGEDNDPMDFDGHGTHVSGIAAGATNNGIGIAALSWGCRIMPLRSGWRSVDGNGYVSSVYASKAYVYAADNDASVCNQSSGTSNIVHDGARYAFKKGVVIVNSAGNSNSDFAASLGSESWALSVAATNSNDGKASYSSYNNKVDIAAPGGDFSSANGKGFLSTVVHPSGFFGNSLYAEFQGTSMASPFVASLAALIKSKHKDWKPAQIMFQITGTADNIDGINSQYAGKLGYGRINALRAVTETPAVPKPDLEFVSYSINDDVGGNGNGIPEAGEALTIIATVRNNWGDAANLTAALSSQHWAASVTKSNASYGDLCGIIDLDSNQRGNNSDGFVVSIDAKAVPEAIPFDITFSSNEYTKKFTFTISIGARILLVDDDDGTVNVEHYYTSALQTLGASYDIWDHARNGTPSLLLLQKYSVVFWSCEWAFPALDSADRSVLSAYLSAGGRLFISGQDIGWDLASADGTEYTASSGTSKTFFEQYLKAKFLGDDAVTGNIIGSMNDTIGSGLSFARYQPQRAAGEQYPDVLDPLGGSVVSMRYADGLQTNKGAAVLYSGDYKLLYFGFGGFESIADSATRITVMDRILRWMFDYAISTDKLSNSENTSAAYPVSAAIMSKTALTSVDLVWNSNGVYPYNTVTMTAQDEKYSASIPAQPANSTVTYFVLAKNTDGYLPFTRSTFFVGVDTLRPMVTVVDTIKHSIRLNGPYSVSAILTDDIGIDTSSARIRYRINGGNEHITPMSRTENDFYAGSIVPEIALSSGDIVSYSITVTDVSQLKNTGRFPLTGERYFIIGRETVDDFEDPQSGRWDLGSWAYTKKQKFRGLYSLTDSPDSNYRPKTERIAVLNSGYDVLPFTAATLTFYQRYSIHNTDTAFLEISQDGTEWKSVKKFTGTNLFWKKESIDLKSLTGTTDADVVIRMRMLSDDSTQADGIYIDEMEIVTDQFVVPVTGNDLALPVDFSLAQNYPNPFNPSTTIRFSIPARSFVSLKVYDMLGREAATVINEFVDAGTYAHHYNAAQLSSGVYFYRLTAGMNSALRKMIFLK